MFFKQTTAKCYLFVSINNINKVKKLNKFVLKISRQRRVSKNEERLFAIGRRDHDLYTKHRTSLTDASERAVIDAKIPRQWCHPSSL
jgi:hypothetical protein